ncbi:MAG: DegV family protein [Caldilineae bacterium]|nr:MAG: DegV family protein [Caldilineae bacterium]
MSKIVVMTDSTCGLPREVLDRYGIIVVPVQVRIGEEVYREGVDLHAEELFQRMFSSQATPATSLPTGDDFRASFQAALDAGADQVLGVFVGSQLSGTFNGARLAAQEFDLEVEMVDSGSTSLALGFLVLHGARRVEAGASLQEAAAELRREADNVEAYALLDTLEYVRRGGRIGRVGEVIANMLNIKPILRVGHNAVEVAARTRSYKKGVNWLRAALEEAAPVRALGLIHTSGESKTLVEQLAEEFRPYVEEGGDLFVEPATAAIAVHTGPNGVGLILWRRAEGA